jgi:hypothetical protein
MYYASLEKVKKWNPYQGEKSISKASSQVEPQDANREAEHARACHYRKSFDSGVVWCLTSLSHIHQNKQSNSHQAKILLPWVPMCIPDILPPYHWHSHTYLWGWIMYNAIRIRSEMNNPSLAFIFFVFLSLDIALLAAFAPLGFSRLPAHRHAQLTTPKQTLLWPQDLSEHLRMYCSSSLGVCYLNLWRRVFRWVRIEEGSWLNPNEWTKTDNPVGDPARTAAPWRCCAQPRTVGVKE